MSLWKYDQRDEDERDGSQARDKGEGEIKGKRKGMKARREMKGFGKGK